MRPKTPRFPRFSGAPRLKVMACSRSALTPGVGSRAHRRRSRAQVARRGTEERSSLSLSFSFSFLPSLSLSPLPSFVPSRSCLRQRAAVLALPRSAMQALLRSQGRPGEGGGGGGNGGRNGVGERRGEQGGRERRGRWLRLQRREGGGGQSGGRPAVTPARLSPKSESERASRDCAPPC